MIRTLEPELTAAPPHGWLAVEVEPGEAHVVPLGDVVLHEADGCVCGPETVPIERPDGSFGYRVDHHALRPVDPEPPHK